MKWNMNKESKILIVGHDDILECSLRNYFNREGYANVTSSSLIGLDASIQVSVYEYFQEKRPEFVILSSTRSGGIEANINHPAEFIYHNLQSQTNILYAAHKFGVKKLLYFAGSCVYPKNCPQPMKPEYLMTAPMETTSESYSTAKLAGIKLCQAYKKQYGFNAVVAIPATVYGVDSDTDLKTSHVMGALIGKFTKAVSEQSDKVIVWGTGEARREFLYDEDFTSAVLLLLENYNGDEIIQIGSGSDVSIKELSSLIQEETGFKGQVQYDSSKPDGTLKKLLDNTSMVNLGWKPKVLLKEGISKTIKCMMKVSCR